MSTITSRRHPLCKLIRSLHHSKERRQNRLFVVEGANAVSAALQAGWPLQELLFAPDAASSAWSDLAHQARIETQLVTPELLEYMSDAQTAPEVMALAEMPFAQAPDWERMNLVLVFDRVSDPGNVGTLLRAADAAGASGVLLTENSADVYSPKVVRASAGSLFHVPLIQLPQRAPEAVAGVLREHEIPVVTAVAHGGESCFEYSWPQRCALVLGHETRGISAALGQAASAHVTIPVYGRAESLNVAMAGTVLLYAWRGEKEKQPRR